MPLERGFLVDQQNTQQALQAILNTVLKEIKKVLASSLNAASSYQAGEG